MSDLFLYVGAFAAVSGLISVFKPIHALKIRTRGMGALVMVLGATLLFISATPSATTAPVAKPAEETPVSAPAPVAKAHDLELLDSSSEVDGYVRYVIGTVKNNSDKTYSYAQVEINLYDSEGNQVGSTLANTNNLEPNTTWKFKAPILPDLDIAKYKIHDITAF